MKSLITMVLLLLIQSKSFQLEEFSINDILESEDILETIEKVSEYPEADYVWYYLKGLGYNDYVCAGILGNIMVEVGGNTLEIDVYLENKYYYGICQWSKYYFPGVIGACLEEQCNYLRDNIKYEIDTFGWCYKKGFNYSSFVEMDDAREAALAFAKSYERCAKTSYKKRQECAEVAYKYFTGQE